MSNDALFAVIAGGYIFGAFTLMIIITAIVESISERMERKRRNEFRNNYMRFK